MNISIVGTGYVGLVSGVCLATKGHHVICYDINRKVVDSLNSGVAHIYESGLQELLTYVLENHRFTAKFLYILSGNAFTTSTRRDNSYIHEDMISKIFFTTNDTSSNDKSG